MQNVFPTSKKTFIGALFCILIVSASWQLPQNKKSANAVQQTVAARYADTSKPGINDNLGNIDESKVIEKTMKDLDEKLKNLSEQMKAIDYLKIEKETQDAIANIDWSKMQQTINASIKQAQEGIAKINKEEIKQKLDEMQQQLASKDFAKQYIDQEKIQKAMQNAEQSMEHEKAEMQQWQDLSNALEKDGLIDKTKPYTVQLKDGVLFINSKQQSKEITEKYKKYYNGKNNFSINKDGENDDEEENDN